MEFSRVQAEFRRLKTQYEASELSEADFKARLQDLMVQDGQGRWWMIGYETGQWYFHDGERWVPAELPEARQPRLAPAAEGEPTPPAMPEASPAPKIKARADERTGPSYNKISLRQAFTVAAVLALVALGIWGLPRLWGPAAAGPTPSPLPATPATTIAVVTTQAQPTPAEKASPAGPEPSPVQPASGPMSAAASVVAPSCDYGGELKAIEALDALTVRFTLCYPDVGFPAKVALPPFGIHPAEYLVATGGAGPLLDTPIGTGPYELEAWRKGSEMRLKANPDYWGQQARISQVQIHWNPDADVRLSFLKAGNIGGMDQPAPQSYADIRSSSDLMLYLRDALNTSYLGISSSAKPFDDVRVRQAIAQAIDREYLVNKYPAGTIIASHFTPCAIPHGCTGEAWYAFDADKARQLLAEAGYPDGFETELPYRDAVRDYLPDPAGIAQDIADMLAESLNIRATPRAMETSEFLEAVGAGKLPLYLAGWVGVYPDPANALNPFYVGFSGKQFRAEFPDIWDILYKAAITASPEARQELYTQANNLILRGVPVVPLAHVGSATAFRASVGGAHSSPLYLENFASMSLKDSVKLVWKQATEPESLYCADEIEPDTLRACAQITEPLLAFQVGSVEVIPALAERYESSEDLTTWTFHLRQGVKFHDGSALDASDVITSWAAQWDASSPLHRGRTGEFAYFVWLFDRFLDASP